MSAVSIAAKPTTYKPVHRVRLLTATALFDGHDASVNIMRRVLQASGAEVIHLGHNRSVQEIVDAALQEDVHGVAITSYQGGHVEFFKYLIDLLRARGGANIKVFGGGGGVIVPAEIQELMEYGVTRLYSPQDGARLEMCIRDRYWLIFHGEWLQWGFLRDVAQAEGQRTDWTLTLLVYGILAAVFFVMGLFFRRVSMRPGSLPTKRPVLFLTAGFALLLAAAALLPIGGMTRVLLWGAVVVMANYLWYFAYALKDAAARTPDGPLLQLGTLRPFWGDSPLPFTKGAAYLRKIEAHTPRDLSITQLLSLIHI